MPSVSKKQHKLMQAAAHNPAFAKKVGIPVDVAKEFNKADKGRKFREGGKMANTSRMNRLEELGRVDSEKAYTPKGKSNLAAEKKRIVGGLKFAKGGMHSEKSEMKEDVKQDKSMIKKAVGMHDKQLHGGKKTNLAKLNAGGRLMAKGEHPVQKQAKRGAEMVKMAAGGKVGLKKQMPTSDEMGGLGMKKGGYVKSADGCAVRGKTRGTMMAGGGKVKKYC